MSHPFPWKELAPSCLLTAACLVVPVYLHMKAHQAPVAPNAATLKRMVIDAHQDDIHAAMKYRFGSTSLKFSGEPDPEDKVEDRWLEVERSIEAASTEQVDTRAIVNAAKGVFTPQWPILAERGYIGDQEAWVVVGSSVTSTDFIGWMCIPSAEEIKREEVRRYCRGAKAYAIAASPPYRVLN